jgi:hypothetical protein
VSGKYLNSTPSTTVVEMFLLLCHDKQKKKNVSCHIFMRSMTVGYLCHLLEGHRDYVMEDPVVLAVLGGLGLFTVIAIFRVMHRKLLRRQPELVGTGIGRIREYFWLKDGNSFETVALREKTDRRATIRSVLKVVYFVRTVWGIFLHPIHNLTKSKISKNS